MSLFLSESESKYFGQYYVKRGLVKYNDSDIEDMPFAGMILADREVWFRYCIDCNDMCPLFYHVWDYIWREAGLHPRGVICLDCLMRRLGRDITINDLDDHYMNGKFWLDYYR